MLNIEKKIEGNILTITIDLSQRHGLSKSGKTISIASTKGNKHLLDTPKGEAIFFGLNVYAFPVRSL